MQQRDSGKRQPVREEPAEAAEPGEGPSGEKAARLELSGPRRSNGLADLASTWSRGELESFEAAVRAQSRVGEELWR